MARQDLIRTRNESQRGFRFFLYVRNGTVCGTCQDTDMNRRVGGNPPLFLVYKSGELQF